MIQFWLLPAFLAVSVISMLLLVKALKKSRGESHFRESHWEDERVQKDWQRSQKKESSAHLEDLGKAERDERARKRAQEERLWSQVGDSEKSALQILGLTPKANRKDIEKAFRSKMLQCHPDRFAGNSDEVQKKANHYALELNEARDLLFKWIERRSAS